MNMPTSKQDSPLLISIIMPAHNAGKFIAESIDSILAQSYENWELLVIDDYSTDDTAKVVADYINKDKRIQYHKAPERIGSPAGVRNIGFKKATGDLIAFLDADDLYLPHTLDTLSSVLLADSTKTAVFGFPIHMDEVGHPLEQGISLVPDETSSTGHHLPSNYHHDWVHIVTGDVTCLLPGLMMRKATLDRVGYFNEELCGPEDYEFFLRLFLDNFKGAVCLPAYVYRYRVHSASLTKAPEHYEKLLTSNLKIMDWLFQHPLLPPELQQVKSRAYIECYRYLGRERLIHNQPTIARELSIGALRNPNISFSTWASTCMPIYLRSWLPSWANNLAAQLRWRLRKHLQGS
ncbi:MAG: glycosyltransferase family 2 protein [Vampirovibrio sp.]|nr:glycosyltransferase family 2 protein [Vampirovibrio sp.]